MLKRGLRYLLPLIALIAICAQTPARAGVMLEGFYFNCPSGYGSPWWWDYLAQQSNTFALDGFTAIWLPCALKGASGGYSSGYDPFDDYDLGDKNQMGTIPTHYGTREQLERLCAMIHANGMQPYEDIVDSHRDGDNGNYVFQYLNYYGTANAGRFPKSASDFYPNVPMESNTPDTTDTPDGRWIMPVTGGQTEINGQEWVWSDYGMKQSGDWLTKALDLDGYRIDDVRAMSWTWLYSWLNYGSMAGKYAVGENYDGNVGDLMTWVGADMQNRCSAFDFPLKFNYLNPMCNNPSSFNMASLVGAGFVAQNPGGAVTFVENHDTDGSNPITQNKLLAYAYIMTNEGYPCVYYKDWSTDPGCYGSGLQAGINNLMWINNFIANGTTQQRWENNSIYVYERMGGYHLLTGLNTASNAQTITCATGFGASVWLHDYTGHEPDVETDGGGNATITIPALNGGNGYCCYSVENINGAFTAPQNGTTQEYAGAIDLDLPPADDTQQVPVSRVYAASGQSISGALYYDTTGWTGSTTIAVELDDPTGKKVSTGSYTSLTAQGTTVSTTASIPGFYSWKIESASTPAGNPMPAYWLDVTYTAPQGFPQSPTLTSVSPAGFLTGSTGATITATGSNFDPTSSILWNGTTLTTTYVSSTSLTASVPASDLSTSATIPVTISTPSPGGGTSSGVNVTVGPPPAAPSGLTASAS